MEASNSLLGLVMRLAFLAALTLPVQGCALAAYGLGVATMVHDSKARENEDYDAYIKRAEEENVRRAKAGLPEQEILSRRAFARQSPLP